MDNTSFHQNFLAAVGTLADSEGEFMPTAFTRHCADLLVEAGEFDDLSALHFEGTGTRRRGLRVNGYDLDNADNSIALVVTHFLGTQGIGVVSATEAKSALKALQYFLTEALDGTFLHDREESTPAYQLAYDLRNRGTNVSRYRLYLLTDGRVSERLRELPSDESDGIPVDFHLWDIERFRQLHESQSGHEPLEIDLRQWSPRGLPALKVASTSEFATYLASVPGSIVAALYGKYGSRLLESNVRSYLTNRGKVNKGIRETIYKSPQNFMAFNNGITATATSVVTSADGGAIVSIEDLQIVNGGQTTASLFFVDKESKGRAVLDQVFVQMKLVVVEPSVASELVPSISRYANSQNAVSAADFFSNSPFHVRMESLSRRILAPAPSGSTLSTKWYYERTRGQYENERNKLAASEAARFEKQYPKAQKLDKPGLAKYVMSWEQLPHTVSAGAQKNFVAFADQVAKAWEKDDAAFNEDYFREAVAKAILFNTIRTKVSKSPWYGHAYLANIVAYTVAKLANLIQAQGRGRLMNFEQIWRSQSIHPDVADVALQIAEAVQGILIDPHRQVQNVTEWAKKTECWNAVRELPVLLPAPLLARLADPSAVAEKRKTAKDTQKIDNGIIQQKRILEIPAEDWAELREFALNNRLASPTDIGILDIVTGRRSGFPTERQSARLLALVSTANNKGFQSFRP